MTIFKRLYDFVRTPYTAWLDLKQAKIELHDLEEQYKKQSPFFYGNLSAFKKQNSINKEQASNFIYNLTKSWEFLSNDFLSNLRKDVFWKKAYFACILLIIPALVAPFTIPLYGAIGFILGLTSFTLFVIKKQNDMSRKITFNLERMINLFMLNNETVTKENLILSVFNLTLNLKDVQNLDDKSNTLQSVTHNTPGVFFNNTNQQSNSMPVQGQQQEIPYTDPNHECIFHMEV